MRVLLNRTIRFLSITAIAGAALAALPGLNFKPAGNQAFAQQEQAAVPERTTRRTPAMREPTFRRLERAQIAIDEKNYPDALEALQDLQGMRGLNSYERAMLWNYYALYYFELDDMVGAIDAYRRVLQEEGISLRLEDTIRYSIAQLYFANEQYEESLQELTEWFVYQPDPSYQAYMFLGQLLYVMRRYDDALQPILTAIDKAKAEGVADRENWHQLLLTIYFEKEDMQNVKLVLEYLIIHFSKPLYWLQLAAVYGELEEEQNQLAAMEVAYEQDIFEKESHWVNLAQLYRYNEVPIKAAQVMLDGFASGAVEETEKNLELLANALIDAKEFDDAVEPLSRAAEMSEDGELSIRLGQVHIERDKWDEAIVAIRQGIRKGDLRREDQAYLVLGSAYFNNDQLSEARQAFTQSRRDRRSRTQSSQWIQFLDGEIDRRRRLAEAMRDD
jgi:tetratricopeptide (TPR) repeat protein